MKFTDLKTPQAKGQELGERLKQVRLNLNLTQDEVGKSAGISRYSVKQLENGKGGVQDLMALLIALDIVDQLDNLVPPQQISPLQILKLKGQERKRASGMHEGITKKEKGDNTDEDLGW